MLPKEQDGAAYELTMKVLHIASVLFYDCCMKRIPLHALIDKAYRGGLPQPRGLDDTTLRVHIDSTQQTHCAVRAFTSLYHQISASQVAHP